MHLGNFVSWMVLFLAPMNNSEPLLEFAETAACTALVARPRGHGRPRRSAARCPERGMQALAGGCLFGCRRRCWWLLGRMKQNDCCMLNAIVHLCCCHAIAIWIYIACSRYSCHARAKHARRYGCSSGEVLRPSSWSLGSAW